MCAALLTQTLPYIFNSDINAGAENVSADGSSFQVSLHDPITIPKGAVDCKVGVVSASVWNSSPNIAASYGNNTFTFTTTAAPAGTYTFVIPDDLYSVDGLSSYLASQFVNLTSPSKLITISGENATQKSIVTFLTSGDSVNFTIAANSLVSTQLLLRPQAQITVSFRIMWPRSIGSTVLLFRQTL